MITERTPLAKVRERPNVVSLSLAAFFNDTGSDMLFAIPAPFIFGLLWDSFIWKVPFIVSGICVGLSAALLMLLVKPRREATWPSG